MSSSLTYRALAALPPALQALARQHVQLHPTDDIGELVSEIALALLELAERSTDARIYSRARSRMRRATQDVAHYSAPLEHDIEQQDDEPSLIRRADIVREVQQRQHVTRRRAQQIVRRAVERAMQGDLFAFAEGGAV
jgi:gamma-glutamyl:cysteine ligase YbdK (ATP-grasp superfamily)